MAKTILVLGATSEIAHHACRLWAADAAQFVLVARDETRLKRVADDLLARGALRCESVVADLTDVSEKKMNDWWSLAGGIDIVVLAYGLLGDQSRAETDLDHHFSIMRVNFGSAAGWLQLAARHMANASGGTLAVIGSVAGDRVRRSNYVYGTAKQALAGYCQGLRLRFRDEGVQVLLFKPGQTRTAMTEHLDTSGPLWSEAQPVGEDLYRAVGKGRSEVYSPGFWRWIMLVIRLIPGFIFRRLPL